MDENPLKPIEFVIDSQFDRLTNFIEKGTADKKDLLKIVNHLKECVDYVIKYKS